MAVDVGKGIQAVIGGVIAVFASFVGGQVLDTYISGITWSLSNLSSVMPAVGLLSIVILVFAALYVVASGAFE